MASIHYVITSIGLVCAYKTINRNSTAFNISNIVQQIIITKLLNFHHNYPIDENVVGNVFFQNFNQAVL